MERTVPNPTVALLEALRLLSFHGDGPAAWGAPLADNPIAFVLDSLGEVVNVWSEGGRLIYSNRLTRDLDLGRPTGQRVATLIRGERRFERRCLRLQLLRKPYVLEVIREIRTT